MYSLHYEQFPDGTVKCIEDEIPFELPEGWMWSNLGTLFNHNTGKALNSSNQGGIELTYITTSNVYWDKFELDDLKIMGFNANEIDKCTVTKGDLLVCEGGDIGRAAIWNLDEPIRIQNHLHRLRPYDKIVTRFYYYIFYLYKLNGRIKGNGIGLQGLSSNALHSIIVPVAPISQQYAIIQKIEESFDLIDSLDEQKTDLESCIATIKSKILDLAIRGKLVPQNLDDEPASVLLERIRAEKEELIKQGKIKRDKKESVIFKGEDNSYYDVIIPPSWKLANLSDVTLNISDGSHNPPPKKNKGVPLLSATNIFDNKINYTSATRWITEEEWIIENARTKIEVGDVLITIVGTIGRTAVVYDTTRFALQRSVAVIKPHMIDSKYLMYVLQAPMIIDWLNTNAKGNAQVGIYLKDLTKLSFPLPPLAEQKRIVAAIETTFLQLDEILNSIS